MNGEYEELSYLEKKKREGLIFTLHNMNRSKPYISIEKGKTSAKPITCDHNFWSRRSGRYRTFEEQTEYIRSGYVDKALPKLSA